MLCDYELASMYLMQRDAPSGYFAVPFEAVRYYVISIITFAAPLWNPDLIRNKHGPPSSQLIRTRIAEEKQ